MNEYWNLWINSSLERHFKTKILKLPVYREGEEVDLNKPRAELRIDGPQIEQLDSKTYKAYVEVNLILTIPKDGNAVYLCDMYNGHVAKAFETCIPCYKIGHESFDGSNFANLVEAKGRLSRGTYISNFGQIDPNIRVLQSTIEGHYETELRNE